MSSTVTASARQYTAANSEYFVLADNASLSTGNIDFAVGAWVYLDSLGAVRNIIARTHSSNAALREYQLYVNSSNLATFSIYNTSGTANTITASTFGALTTATWYFVYAYCDADGNIGISVNDGTANTLTKTVTMSDTAVGTAVGSLPDTASSVWDGRLATVFFFKNGIPAASIITSIYNAGAGKFYKDLATADKTLLISWWDGAETSGNLLDANSTNNLTDTNTVTSAAGKVTYTAEDASQFTAANSEYLSINSNSTLQTGDIDFSFAGWAYMDSLATFRILLPTKWSGVSGSLEYALEYDTSPSVGFAWYVSSNGTLTASVVATAPVIVVNNWYFIVCWHDSVNNVIRISVNDGTVYSTAHSTGVYVGTTAFTPGKISTLYMSGRMTNWSFWKKVLSASEITQLYNRGFGLDYTDYDAGLLTSLISSWPLTEASGTRVDVHGTNDLTDNNSVTGNPGVVYDAQAVVTFRPTMMLLGVG